MEVLEKERVSSFDILRMTPEGYRPVVQTAVKDYSMHVILNKVMNPEKQKAGEKLPLD